MRTSREHAAAHNDLHLLTHPGLWVCAVAAAFAMTTAHAASSPQDLSVPSDAASLSAKQAYEHDRAYCNSGQATEPRALCLKEAARAYHDDRAGRLVEPYNAQAADNNDNNDNSANASGTGTRRSQRDDRH